MPAEHIIPSQTALPTSCLHQQRGMSGPGGFTDNAHKRTQQDNDRRPYGMRPCGQLAAFPH